MSATDTRAPEAPIVHAAAAARRPRRRTTHGGRLGRRVNLLYLPALAIFGLFTLYPLLSGIQLSFTNWNGYSAEYGQVGGDNYLRLLQDGNFRTAMLNTLVYGIGSTLVQQVLGLGLALALDRALRGRGLVRTIVYLPVLVSPIVMGTMYSQLFRLEDGAINDVLGVLGIPQVNWLSDAGLSVGIIVVVNSLQFVGISMVIYLAGLQAIPQELREAAALDGANPLQRFVSVTAPLLQPAFATSIVLNLIGGLKLYDVITVLTGGGPGYSTHSVSSLITATYFDNQAAGYASAMGVVLFAVIAVLTMTLNGALNRRRVDA